MNILFLDSTLAGGGAEKLINDLLPIFKNYKQENKDEKIYCKVLILTEENAKYISSLKKNGIIVDVVPKEFSKSHIKRMIFIKKYINQGDFDIIHANLFPVFYYCAILKLFFRKQIPHLVMTEHSTDNKRRHKKLLKYIEKIIYGTYEYVISISEETRSALLKWLKPKKNEKFVVINNGIYIEYYSNAKKYNRNELIPNIKENEIIIGVIASIKKIKGYPFIIEVIKNLSSDFHLLCVGEGELYEDIKKLIENYRLTDRVHLLGFRTDIALILKTIDIVVIPSKYEGFGLVAVEAMASGKPLVISNVPGLSEIVDKAGIKCEVDNVEEFSKAIVKQVQKINNKVYQDELLKRAKLFDIKNTARQYIEIYNKCLKK